MLKEWVLQHPYVTIGLISLLINVPCGYIRQSTPKFSVKWFFWIHASIPFIIYARVTLGTSKFFIPGCIFWAVLGQIWGSRLRRKVMTPQDWNFLKQIPPIIRKRTKHIDESKVLLALLNMGGPRTNNDVRDFQMRLFSDSRLIRFPMSWAFQKLFAQLLVFFRSKAAERRYRLIGGGSPIFDSTKAQAQALQEEFNRRGRSIQVTFSFNYSHPLPDETIDEAKSTGKQYLLPLSLYPHYSKATTGSNIHYLKKSAQERYPELKFLDPPQYYLHSAYITAFVDRITEQIRPGESLDDFYLLFSAHGLPLYFLTEVRSVTGIY